LRPQSKTTGAGTFYRLDYDIVLLFGMTELKAQVAWKENVSRLHMLFNPTDIGLILCVVFRELRNGKFLKRNFFLSLIGPLFKKQLFNEQHFKHSLPTDKSFIITNPQEFEKEKQNLIDMVNSFSESSMSGEAHPFFGKLTKEEWSKGTWKHLDHHLQQFGV